MQKSHARSERNPSWPARPAPTRSVTPAFKFVVVRKRRRRPRPSIHLILKSSATDLGVTPPRAALFRRIHAFLGRNWRIFYHGGL